MSQLINVLLLVLGFALVSSTIVLSINHYSRKNGWDYKLSISVAVSIAFSVLVIALWIISNDLKYLIGGLIYSTMLGVFMYLWLKHKKVG